MTRDAERSSRPAGRYNGRMRQQAWVRAGLVAVGGLLLAGGVGFLAVVPPTDSALYPKCQLHQLTGLHCMGCGATRSAHSLLNGRVGQAFAYNLFAPAAVVWLAVEAVRRGWYRLRGRPDPGWWFRAGWTPGLLAALGVYMLLRNLPAWPFTLLAPHEVG